MSFLFRVSSSAEINGILPVVHKCYVFYIKFVSLMYDTRKKLEKRQVVLQLEYGISVVFLVAKKQVTDENNRESTLVMLG